MVASNCEDCGFNLEKLPMQLPASRKATGSPEVELTLHCPMCGHRIPKVLEDRGLFWRASEGKYRYWEEGHLSRVDKRDLFVFKMGERLELKFAKPAEPIGMLEICHIAVPCFLDGEKMQVPTLPVREEYLDCLDEKALKSAREGDPSSSSWAFGQLKRVDGKTVYVCDIPYRHLPRDRWRLSKPINLVPGGAVVGGVPVFAGLFVRHWPNVDNIRWRHHLVSFGANSDAVSLLKDYSWAVRALIPRRAHDARVEAEAEKMRVVEVPPVKPGLRFSTVSCEGTADDRARDSNRPAWIAVSVEGRGGGLFALPPARADEPQEPPLVFGLDFGTSNTVLATEEAEGKVETVKPETGARSTTRRVFGRCTTDDPNDLWPGAPWAGPHHDLLPSELMAALPWGQIAVRPDQIGTMQLGVDIGVPLHLWSQGNVAPEGASQRILGDFKWERAIRARDGGAGLAGRISWIQARFLELAVLSATAWKLCNGRAYPNQIQVNYSYPPAFSPTDLESLSAAAVIAEDRLAGYMGLEHHGQGPKSVQFKRGPDEAQAAVVGSKSHRMFTVFVDIGGGSLEVLVEDNFAAEKQKGHDGLQPEVVSNSVYFGGGAYLRSLVRGDRNCVYSDYTTLAAQVRNFPNGRTLLRAEKLFKPGRVGVAQKRAAVYGQAVADYVARLLAGVCLEHGYQHGGGDGAQQALNLSHNRLFLHHNGRWQLGEDHASGRRVLFTLMLLGNGWNTVEVALKEGMGLTLEDHFAALVRERLQQIIGLEHALAARIRDDSISLAQLKIHVECPAIVGRGPDQVLHRKAVVASNLAHPKEGSSDPKDHVRGVVGLELNVDGRVVPWHRAWGAPQVLAPGDHPKRTAATTGSQHLEEKAVVPPVRPTAAPSTAAAPPARPQWFLGATDPPTGPFTLSRLVELALEGRDAAAAARLEVWRDGLTWAAIGSIPEVMAELSKRTSLTVSPSAPPARPVWFVAEATGETGPWTVSVVLEKALHTVAGEASAVGRVEVWREGLDGWKRIDALPELKEALDRKLAATQPPVRPPTRQPATATADDPTRPPPRKAPEGPPPRKAPEGPPPRKVAPKEWHLDDGQEATGPWTVDELVARACAGRTRAAALALLVWRAGMGDWVAIEAVAELQRGVEGRTS